MMCFHGLNIKKEEKLLKPGNTYTVGRAKAGQSPIGRVNIDSKAVSHEHIDLIIGAYEIDDVVYPTSYWCYCMA
jgi:hypothetical protein